MDIYHTKKQTEYIARSCSYLLWKTLFYFISQCTSAPYLESGLGKLDNEVDNCNFTFVRQKQWKVVYLFKLYYHCIGGQHFNTLRQSVCLVENQITV